MKAFAKHNQTSGMECQASTLQREVIIYLFGTINFTTKDWLQLVWTVSFHIVDQLGPVFKGPVVVPQYLNQSRPVAVASCLILK